jgi:cellulose synthase/poly-beta-1,6-N-acetylglucosamine synthase-like glycosyltransferase
MREALELANLVFLSYFGLVNMTYLLMTAIAIRMLVSHARRQRSFQVHELIARESAPPISIVAPMYNEEATSVQSVQSLLALSYQHYEVIMVNDGSKDNTLDVVIASFDMERLVRYPTANIPCAPIRGVYRSRQHRNLWLIDKENGGKADALNSGINYCSKPLFCAIDADTVLDKDALLRIVRPFIEDSTTIAAGGIIRIVNDCPVHRGRVADVRMPKNRLARYQVLEYLRAFLAGRVGWDALGMVLIISGAFGLFKRSAVVESGGYATDTVGEDMELVVRLHRHFRETKRRYSIRFIGDPVAWTECPESTRVLGRQRDRWQRGLTQVLTRHRKMLLNPRYGRIGMFAYPYFFFLEMIGPAIEIVGYVVFLLAIITGSISWIHAAAFFAVAVVLGVVLSVLSVVLEEISFRRYNRTTDLLRLFWLAIEENFGYRQLNTWWRLKGLYSQLRGRTEWGEMKRKGFTVEAQR